MRNEGAVIGLQMYEEGTNESQIMCTVKEEKGLVCLLLLLKRKRLSVLKVILDSIDSIPASISQLEMS